MTYDVSRLPLSIGRSMRLFALSAAASMVAAMPVQAESLAFYVQRIDDICAINCLAPFELKQDVRELKEGEESERAATLYTAVVREFPDRYELHLVDQFTPDCIVIEMEEEVLYDLLNPPLDYGANTSADAPAPQAGGILVRGKRRSEIIEPSLEAAEALFLKRRVIVRGPARAQPLIAGIGRRRRESLQVRIVLGNADDIVILPNQTRDGKPIFDGPLEGLEEGASPEDFAALSRSMEAVLP